MHTWMFIYIEYRRGLSSIPRNTPNCCSYFPAIKGWCSVYLIPDEPPQVFSGIDGKALPTTLTYVDDTKQRAYITSNGELIGVFPLSSPRFGVLLNSGITIEFEMRIILVSRILSWSDIYYGTRGNVLTRLGLRHNGH